MSFDIKEIKINLGQVITIISMVSTIVYFGVLYKGKIDKLEDSVTKLTEEVSDSTEVIADLAKKISTMDTYLRIKDPGFKDVILRKD